MFFAQVGDDGKSGSGYDHIKSKLESDDAWKGYKILDVAFNNIPLELGKVAPKSAEEIQEQEARELRKISSVFGGLGISGLKFIKTASGYTSKVAGYSIEIS